MSGSEPIMEGHPVQHQYLPYTLSSWDRLQSPITLNWNKQIGKKNILFIYINVS